MLDLCHITEAEVIERVRWAHTLAAGEFQQIKSLFHHIAKCWRTDVLSLLDGKAVQEHTVVVGLAYFLCNVRLHLPGHNFQADLLQYLNRLRSIADGEVKPTRLRADTPKPPITHHNEQLPLQVPPTILPILAVNSSAPCVYLGIGSLDNALQVIPSPLAAQNLLVQACLVDKHSQNILATQTESASITAVIELSLCYFEELHGLLKLPGLQFMGCRVVVVGDFGQQGAQGGVQNRVAACPQVVVPEQAGQMATQGLAALLLEHYTPTISSYGGLHAIIWQFRDGVIGKGGGVRGKWGGKGQRRSKMEGKWAGQQTWLSSRIRRTKVSTSCEPTTPQQYILQTSLNNRINTISTSIKQSHLGASLDEMAVVRQKTRDFPAPMRQNRHNNFISMQIGAYDPQFDAVKKALLHDALAFNLHQQSLKQERRLQERQREIQEFQTINRRVSTELSMEQQRERTKKYYIRDLLAHTYDQQMERRREQSEQATRHDRTYAQLEVENQNEYHQRRARELARVLRAQRALASTTNPEHQDTPKHKETPRDYEIPTTNLKHYGTLTDPNHYDTPGAKSADKSSRRRVQTEVPAATGPHDIYTHEPVISLDYKNYLKDEIEKRRQHKQAQARQRLEVEKQIALRNTKKMEDEKQMLREIQRKQQSMYRRGLDQQIAEKRSFRSFH